MLQKPQPRPKIALWQSGQQENSLDVGHRIELYYNRKHIAIIDTFNDLDGLGPIAKLYITDKNLSVIR